MTERSGNSAESGVGRSWGRRVWILAVPPIARHLAYVVLGVAYGTLFALLAAGVADAAPIAFAAALVFFAGWVGVLIALHGRARAVGGRRCGRCLCVLPAQPTEGACPRCGRAYHLDRLRAQWLRLSPNVWFPFLRHRGGWSMFALVVVAPLLIGWGGLAMLTIATSSLESPGTRALGGAFFVLAGLGTAALVFMFVPPLRTIVRNDDEQRCAACGYSLHGLEGGKRCPECGVRTLEGDAQPGGGRRSRAPERLTEAEYRERG